MMFGLIILVIVAYFIFTSKDGRSCCRQHQVQKCTSTNILNDRYARSEINKEDYLERKQELLLGQAFNIH